MPHRSQARDISPICSQLSGPCSPSSQMPSKPNCPRKSIMSVLASPDTTVTGFPSCNFRLIRFSRIQVLLVADGSQLSAGGRRMVALWQNGRAEAPLTDLEQVRRDKTPFTLRL